MLDNSHFSRDLMMQFQNLTTTIRIDTGVASTKWHILYVSPLFSLQLDPNFHDSTREIPEHVRPINTEDSP
jgi:hypothetical protein